MKRILSALALTGAVAFGLVPFTPIGSGSTDVSWGGASVHLPV